MAGKTTKRSQPVSMEEKIAAIARVQAGESKASVARDLVIPESTLRGWCKNEKKISFLSNKRLSSPDSDDSGSNGPKLPKRVRKSSPIGSRDRWSDLITQSEQFSYNTPTFTQSAAGAGLDYSSVMKQWTNAIFQQLQGMPSSASATSWPLSGAPTTTGASATTGTTPTTSLGTEDQLPWLSHQALLQNILTPSTTPTTQAGNSVNSVALAYAMNAYKLNLLSSVGPSSLPTARVSPNPAISRSTSTSPLSSIYGAKSEPINLSEPRYSCSENEADDAPLNMTVNHSTPPVKSTSPSPKSTSPSPVPSLPSNEDKEEKGDKKDNVENSIAEQKPEVEKPRNLKNRTVLDSLYHNNNNNINENDKDRPKQTREEGVKHGDMFLEFLKDCGEPFVTQVQVSLVASLMRNFHNSDTRKFKRSKRK